MKRPSLIRRLLGKLRGQAATETPAKPSNAATPPQEGAAPKPARRRTESSFEPLEGRIAPAVLLNASTIQFTDTTGDLVTVSFSKALFKEGSVGLNALLDDVFQFKTAGTVRTASEGGSAADVHELALLDLTKLASVGSSNPIAGGNISITAVKQNGVGDDLVNVGYIKAATSAIFGTSLGNVVVDGDLGQIDAGDRTKPVGIASLTVASWGTLGTTTQLDAGKSLESNVTGAITKLKILGDFKDATLNVVNGDVARLRPGKIGSIEIGGDILVTADSTTANAGLITAAGSIGSILVSDIFGGGGDNSGKISTTGSIGTLTISGGLHGGAGKDSGQINATEGIKKITLGTLWAGKGEASGRIVSSGDIGTATIGTIKADQAFGTGDAGKNAGSLSTIGKIGTLVISGDLLGGKGDNSGYVSTGLSINKVTVGGLVKGGVGDSSGQMIAAGGFGTIVLDRIMVGGEGDSSGAIVSNAGIKSVLIKNSVAADGAAALIGGKGVQSGSISALGTIGSVTINGHMDASLEDAERGSGAIVANGDLGKVTITGNVIGGESELTGAIVGDGKIGTVKITGSLIGGSGVSSGSLIAGGKVTSVTIGGSLDGGTGANSGSVIAGNDVTKPGDLVKITVAGQLLGDGADSASIRAGGKIVSATIGTKTGPIQDVLLGGAGSNSAAIVGNGGIGTLTIYGNVVGDDGINSGSVQGKLLLNTVKISGNLQGGLGDGSGSIQARDITSIFESKAGNVGNVTVSGSILGGDGEYSGAIFADGSIKSVVTSAVTGSNGDFSGSIVAGRGTAAFLDEFRTIGTIGTVTINGAFSGGMGVSAGTIEGGARIKSVIVKGDATDVAIKTGRDIGSLSVIGNFADSLVTAQGSAKPTAKADVAIGKIAITDTVSNSTVLAGYDLFGNASNGNAQIGSVKVGTDWVASSLVAGVEDIDGDGFGDEDDARISGGTISKIASIVIGGAVSGTSALDDHFGFVAGTITSVKIGGVAQALTSGVDVIPLAGSPVTDDTSIREIA